MISFICAKDLNNAVGYNNQLLCHLGKDMEFFKVATREKTVIMGRSTFESIGKPLKDRRNVVLSKSGFKHEDVDVYHNYEDILQEAFETKEEYIVIGGQQVWELFRPFVDRLYLTQVYHMFDNKDTYFPHIFGEFESIYTHHVHDEDYPYTMQILEKKSEK